MHGAITAGGSWMAVNLVRSQTRKAKFSRLQNNGGVWSKKGGAHRAFLLHLVCKTMLADSDVKRVLFPPQIQQMFI